MLDKPHIAQAAAQRTAVIRLTVPRAEIRHVMGLGYRELMAAVPAQGVAPVGPWFSHHLRMDPEIFDAQQTGTGSSGNKGPAVAFENGS
jgi:hypothetical protein